MKQRSNMKVETFLPVFPGFYGTMFDSECHEEQELGYINQIREDNDKKPIIWDQLKPDYEAFSDDVAEQCVEFISGVLEDLGIIEHIELQNIYSPREYNWSNDSIDIKVTLSPDNVDNIKTYLQDNAELFDDYIQKRYTSYDGFWSHYSNDSEEWLGDPELLTHQHKLGSVLEFICMASNITENDMYNYLEVSLNIKNFKHLTMKCPRR